MTFSFMQNLYHTGATLEVLSSTSNISNITISGDKGDKGDRRYGLSLVVGAILQDESLSVG